MSIKEFKDNRYLRILFYFIFLAVSCLACVQNESSSKVSDTTLKSSNILNIPTRIPGGTNRRGHYPSAVRTGAHSLNKTRVLIGHMLFFKYK